VATHFGAAATLGWVIAEWLWSGKPSVLGGISDAGGLVAITPRPASSSRPALLIGCARVWCATDGHRIKASSGTTIPWTLSACTGRVERWGLAHRHLATNAVNDGLRMRSARFPWPGGWQRRAGAQPVHRLRRGLGAGHRGTLGHFEICDLTLGLRVSKPQEIEGLDVSMHGEEGYIFES